MSIRARLRKLARSTRGATIVEFALLLGPLLIIVTGTLDLGWQAYAASVLQGSLQDASRSATLEGANLTAINDKLRTNLSIFAQASDISVTSQSFKSFSGIGNPEKITTDTPPLGVYNIGDCYIDANNNGIYDTAQGTNGIGGADDIIKYTVTMQYHRLTPWTSWIGFADPATLTATTVLRNQPFGGVIDPPTRCN